MAERTPSWMITEELVSEELRERFSTLTAEEFRAINEALVWYAKSRNRDIVDLMSRPELPGRERIEQFERLHSGLRKLGTRIRSPFVSA